MISPLALSFLLSLVALLLYSKGKVKKAKTILATAIAWICIWSQPYAANLVLYPLEHIQEQPDATGKPDFIFVLACYYNPSAKVPETSKWHECSLQRLVEALRLHNKTNAPIVLTGGEFLSDKNIPFAALSKNYLIQLGVNDANIIAIDQGTNTKEEVKAAGNILRGQDVWAITSATHTHRVKLHLGSEVNSLVVFPVDFLTSGSLRPSIELPSAMALERTRRGFYEYLAIAKDTLANY